MAIDMVNNVQDAMIVDPIDDDLFSFMDNAAAPLYFRPDASQTGLETWAVDYDYDQAYATQSQPFQFGCRREENSDDFINFAPLPAPPTQWWYPEDSGAGWDSAYSENGGLTPSASSVPGGMDSATWMEGSSGTELQFVMTGVGPSIETSWGDNTIIQPYVTSYPSESTQSERTPARWTYRQILETVAFKPHGAPHLWEDRISQLAAELGMPKGTTQEEIVTVAPLVRALAGAPRLVHGHTVVPMELRPLVRELDPDAAQMLGILDCAGEPGLNTAGHSDETSPASGKEQPLSDSPSNPDETKKGQANRGKPARKRRVAEEDLYCRVGTCQCLESFKDSHVCAKHRKRHFTQVWSCPGPCRTKTRKEGWFARKETLKRHLLSPKFAECMEEALKILGPKILPESSTGSGWMAPFCEGTERLWESPGFKLTDLETVKGWLQDPNFKAPPVQALRGRHRSKYTHLRVQ